MQFSIPNLALAFTLLCLVLLRPCDARGNNLARCRINSDCNGQRRCSDLLTGKPRRACRRRWVYCVCHGSFEKALCTNSGKCAAGEVCVKVPDDIPVPFPVKPRVCVDTTQLFYIFFRRSCSRSSDCGNNPGTCINIQGKKVCAAP